MIVCGWEKKMEELESWIKYIIDISRKFNLIKDGDVEELQNAHSAVLTYHCDFHLLSTYKY
jgi:hypothetical protein